MEVFDMEKFEDEKEASSNSPEELKGMRCESHVVAVALTAAAVSLAKSIIGSGNEADAYPKVVVRKGECSRNHHEIKKKAEMENFQNIVDVFEPQEERKEDGGEGAQAQTPRLLTTPTKPYPPDFSVSFDGMSSPTPRCVGSPKKRRGRRGGTSGLSRDDYPTDIRIERQELDDRELELEDVLEADMEYPLSP